MDPASDLDAVRNIGLVGGSIAVITTRPIQGRDTVDARGLGVAPGFIDLHAHGQTPETYRFYALDRVTTALEFGRLASRSRGLGGLFLDTSWTWTDISGKTPVRAARGLCERRVTRLQCASGRRVFRARRRDGI